MEHDVGRAGESPDDTSARAALAARAARAAQAARSVTQGLVTDAGRVGGLVHERGAVGEPVPVRPPGLSRDLGAAHVRAWFVPVTVGERLAGFAVVDVSTPTPPTDTADRDEDPGGETDDVPDDDRADVRPPAARIRRWSTFQRHEGDLESCPEARLWTDPRTITSTAAAAVGVADAVGGEPVLTWERSPEHLVWEVTVGGRRVHVAGSSAWPA